MRRLLALLLGTVLVAGGVFALLLAFNARDDAGVSGSNAAAGPGQLQPDLGSRHLDAGQHVPREGLTDPPTSGPHATAALSRMTRSCTRWSSATW